MKKLEVQTINSEVKSVKAWFDGACEPINPHGHTTYGVVIQIKRDGQLIEYEDSVYVGSGEGMSNNVAEYSGCIAALEFLIKLGLENEEIEIIGDSNLVIQQLSGNWRAKNGMYKPYYERAMNLKERFSNITFKWIAGKDNFRADRLSRMALKTKEQR